MAHKNELIDWGVSDQERVSRAVRHKVRRRRRKFPALLLLLCLVLFCGGFILGQATEQAPAKSEDPAVVDGAAPAEDGQDQDSGESSGGTDASGTGSETTGDAGVQEPAEPEIPDSSPIAQEPEIPAVDTTAWNLQLINWENPLPEDYEAGELTELSNGHAVDSRIYPALQEMMDDARAAGYNPLICSSFRTWDKQSQLYERKVQFYIDQGSDRATAEEQAAVWVARPGTSEHQTGLSADIVTPTHQTLDPEFADTEAGQWLSEHAYEYGFVLRYPADKQDVTGIIYESWHYRFVGKTHAKLMKESGLCLEEYLQQEVPEGYTGIADPYADPQTDLVQ